MKITFYLVDGSRHTFNGDAQFRSDILDRYWNLEIVSVVYEPPEAFFFNKSNILYIKISE